MRQSFRQFDAKESPFKGTATLTDVQAKAFADGMVYFNIHTAEHKPGEIRGQMMMVKQAAAR